MTTAQEITDVVSVDRKFNTHELAEFINLAIRKENEELHQEIKKLRQELANFKQEQEKKAQDRDAWRSSRSCAKLQNEKSPGGNFGNRKAQLKHIF